MRDGLDGDGACDCDTDDDRPVSALGNRRTKSVEVRWRLKAAVSLSGWIQLYKPCTTAELSQAFSQGKHRSQAVHPCIEPIQVDTGHRSLEA